MGGAGGHMPHPHDLSRVKDGEGLIQFFRDAVDSIMEGNASLKIDGSNASFKLVDNIRGGKEFVGDRGSLHPFDVKGITANNAADRFEPQENKETGEMQPHGMIQTYTDILNIFNEALNSTEVDIVPELKILGVYDNPTLIFNTEYVKGQTNVQEYDHDFLAIHNLGQIYEKHSNKGYRPGIPRPEIEDPETKEKKAIGDFSTGVMLDKDQQKAMDSLLAKVGQVAGGHGFKIYGTVPAGPREDASVDLDRALSENFSITYDDDFGDVDTYSLDDWLSTAKNPIHEAVVLANGDQVSAMAKERIYNPIASGVSIEELLGPAPIGSNTSPNATKAVYGAVFWEAERVLGKEILNALTSDMGDAGNHEGVVLRDPKRFGVDAVKITGDFILRGMTSQHRKKKEETSFKCRKAGMIALVPGGYKPPHVEHLNMIKHYASVANKVFVFVSPLARGSDKGDEHHITKEMSESIWSLYLKNAGLSRQVKLLPSETNSPVQTSIDWVTQPGNARKGDCIILGASTKPDEKGVPDVKGRFDRGYIEDYLKEKFPKIAEMVTILEPTDPGLIHNATVDMSGTDFRRALAAKDYEKIRTFIPVEVNINQVLAILGIPPEPEIELEPEELELKPEESGVLPENKKKGVFSSVLYGLIEEALDEQTEPIQRKYRAQHRKGKKRLISKGGNKHFGGGKGHKRPSMKRTKSSPPIGENENLVGPAEFVAGRKSKEQACYEDPNCKALMQKKKKSMKFTKVRLKAIIKEEINNALNEVAIDQSKDSEINLGLEKDEPKSFPVRHPSGGEPYAYTATPEEARAQTAASREWHGRPRPAGELPSGEGTYHEPSTGFWESWWDQMTNPGETMPVNPGGGVLPSRKPRRWKPEYSSQADPESMTTSDSIRNALLRFAGERPEESTPIGRWDYNLPIGPEEWRGRLWPPSFTDLEPGTPERRKAELTYRSENPFDWWAWSKLRGLGELSSTIGDKLADPYAPWKGRTKGFSGRRRLPKGHPALRDSDDDGIEDFRDPTPGEATPIPELEEITPESGISQTRAAGQAHGVGIGLDAALQADAERQQSALFRAIDWPWWDRAGGEHPGGYPGFMRKYDREAAAAKPHGKAELPPPKELRQRIRGYYLNPPARREAFEKLKSREERADFLRQLLTNDPNITYGEVWGLSRKPTPEEEQQVRNHLKYLEYLRKNPQKIEEQRGPSGAYMYSGAHRPRRRAVSVDSDFMRARELEADANKQAREADAKRAEELEILAALSNYEKDIANLGKIQQSGLSLDQVRRFASHGEGEGEGEDIQPVSMRSIETDVETSAEEEDWDVLEPFFKQFMGQSDTEIKDPFKSQAIKHALEKNKDLFAQPSDLPAKESDSEPALKQTTKVKPQKKKRRKKPSKPPIDFRFKEPKNLEEISAMAAGAVEGPGRIDKRDDDKTKRKRRKKRVITTQNEQLIDDVINYLLKNGSQA